MGQCPQVLAGTSRKLANRPVFAHIHPPLRYYLERVLRDMGGGILHWAAKGARARRDASC